MKTKLELMDWKEIETGAENAIRQANKDIAIAEILYKEAVINIKKLKGKTNQEQDEEARENAKRAKDCTTEEADGDIVQEYPAC